MKTALRSFAVLAGSVAALALAGAAPGAETPAPAPASASTPAAEAATPVSAAKLVAAEPVRDVGKVMRGERIAVAFELRNEGTDELVLSDVRPACGCTVASFDARIAPGKSGKVHAEVDTAEFSGPIAKTITVLSNDATNPRLTLTIKAVVEQTIKLQPGFARFNYVQTQPPISAQQWIWTDEFADFRLTAVESPYKFIQATFREAGPDERRSEGTSARQWIVETTIQPDAEVGALRDFLVVKTNHPKQKELKIPLSGFVRPILSVTPYVADFGSVTMTPEGKDLSIIVTNFGKEPVEITRVTTGVAGVEATVKAIETGKRFEIRLALTPAMAKGSVSSTLKIETSSPAKPTLDVPFKGTVS